jgi:hypothetical protein
MIEVAIVSIEQALTADGAEIPAGSAVPACRPLSPDADRGTITVAPAGSLQGSGTKP